MKESDCSIGQQSDGICIFHNKGRGNFTDIPIYSGLLIAFRVIAAINDLCLIEPSVSWLFLRI